MMCSMCDSILERKFIITQQLLVKSRGLQINFKWIMHSLYSSLTCCKIHTECLWCLLISSIINSLTSFLMSHESYDCVFANLSDFCWRTETLQMFRIFQLVVKTVLNVSPLSSVVLGWDGGFVILALVRSGPKPNHRTKTWFHNAWNVKPVWVNGLLPRLCLYSYIL